MTVCFCLQVMAGAFAERKVMLKQKQADLDAQARFLAGGRPRVQSSVTWCKMTAAAVLLLARSQHLH
jgi:hypothetical protein